MLPTAQSDLPVLTFLAVVTRPAVHMIFTGIAFVGVCIASFAVPGGAGKVGYFVLGMIAIYFANFAIGYVFDCLSVIIGIANNVRNIERRK